MKLDSGELDFKDFVHLRTLSRLATADGMVTMRKRGLLLAARGLTSLEEVLLRTPADEP